MTGDRAAPSCSLAIRLGKQSRAYRFGEAISGQVIVEVAADCHCEKLTLTCEWRIEDAGAPHGPSERGGTTQLELYRGNWEAGKRFSYDFSVPAAKGPVTAEGKTFKLDWRLSARADFRYADESCEEEIQLVPDGEPDFGPAYQAPEPLPKSAGSPTEPYWWLLVGICFAGLGLAMAAVLYGAVSDLPLPVMTAVVLVPGSPFLAPFLISVGGMAIGTGMAIWQIYQDYLLGPLGTMSYEVEPRQLLPGHKLTCSITFRPRVAGHLDLVSVALFREERIYDPGKKGQAAAWLSERAFETVLPLLKNRILRKGLPVLVKGVLEVPADAPPTLEAERHAALWFVRFVVRTPGRPDVARRFRVTVLPAPPHEADWEPPPPREPETQPLEESEPAENAPEAAPDEPAVADPPEAKPASRWDDMMKLPDDEAPS